MNNIKQTGIRISQYPQGPVNATNKKKKLLLHHSFISWAPAYYGICSINKNYQIPIKTLRQDMLGYIGVNNSKGEYRNYINFWYGDWFNTERTKSYVYEWLSDDIGHDDYIPNKHGLQTVIENGVPVKSDDINLIDRVFILNDAPWPLEAVDTAVNPKDSANHGEDPNPHSAKLVTKNYVDDRHNGVRKVQLRKMNVNETVQKGSELKIRPYTCFYQYSNTPAKDTDGVYTINITDTEVLEDGRKVKDLIRYNRLTFFLRIKNNSVYYENTNGHANNLKLLVNGSSDNLKWSYHNEWTEILRECRPKINADNEQINVAKDYIFVRCQAEYIDGQFVVTCSNFFGRGKNSKRIVETPIPQSKQVNIKLSLHENESFLTQIPSDNVRSPQQIYIKLDASDIKDLHEYTWNYYIITPDKNFYNDVDDKGEIKDQDIKNFDDTVIFQGGETPIMWAMEDGYNIAPRLEPNKIYCFEFVKVFDNILIGRIKYFINLIKKA